MTFLAQRKPIDLGLWTILGAVLAFQYATFATALSKVWFSDQEFSYGLVVPILVVYLIWMRRNELREATKTTWTAGLAIAAAGSCLRILAALTGTLISSGVALAVSLIGIAAFLWGRQVMRIVAFPLALLVLMVPLPSYVSGQFTWNLQQLASTFSANVLGTLGVPVYQEGNLLNLPNYVLEVREACSGSRSIFALIALALILGLTVDRKWRVRIALVLAAPVLAVATNVIRIVGTGLLAWRFGSVAANESLHTVWGVAIFLMAVAGLVAFQRFLQWATNAYA